MSRSQFGRPRSMPTISLQDIRDAADKKYGPLVIEGVEGGDVTLLNPIRLSKDKRAALSALDDDDSVDTQDKLESIIKIAAKTPGDAERLLGEFGDDLGQLAEALAHYTGGAQVGEASTSPS